MVFAEDRAGPGGLIMSVYPLAKKEWMLLARDWHALLLLFVMPAAFILVMSLAFQNQYAARQGVKFQFYLINHDRSPSSDQLVHDLLRLKQFSRKPSHASMPSLMHQVRRDHVQFLVSIPKGFGRNLQSSNPMPIRFVAGPNVEPAIYSLFEHELQASLMRVYLYQTMAPLRDNARAAGSPLEFSGYTKRIARLLKGISLYQVDGRNRHPSSVQQNVPAWLVFAMFFIAIPLSTTWIQENQQGTYLRLRSMGVGSRDMLLGKMLPYLGVNLLQVVFMILVGMIVVPWFGGERLMLGHELLGICLVSIAIAFSAVSYALLIANLVSTSEQATILTGVGNLLMAAVGGIMVPRFLMPPFMRTLSLFSPMAWGLNGFLDVFLERTGLRGILFNSLWLFIFGCFCLLSSGLLLARKRRI